MSLNRSIEILSSCLYSKAMVLNIYLLEMRRFFFWSGELPFILYNACNIHILRQIKVSSKWVALQERLDAIDKIILYFGLDSMFTTVRHLLHKLLNSNVFHTPLADDVYKIMLEITLAMPLQIVLPSTFD
jgi:hypothetical protein